MTARPPYPPGVPAPPNSGATLAGPATPRQPAHPTPPMPPSPASQAGTAVPSAPRLPAVPPAATSSGQFAATPATTTGQLPAVGSAPASSPSVPTSPTGTIPGAAPRIMVQYPQVGSRLVSKKGEYEVRRVIGAGEFGAVYDCVGPFDQVYAVKVIRPANRPYQEVYAEWARETQRLLSLRHPNVVYIYDAFEQDHLFYMALERCDHALSDMLGAPMQEGLVIELARQLLAALSFLHDHDIVHDDLHPGNVLIVHATDRPIVKISDFGISHELRGASAIRPNVVNHAIMAPEVVANGYTSKQSDIYQIGLLMYWMLTGEPAIPKGAGYQDLVRVVAEGIPRARAEAIGTPLGGHVAKMLRRRDAYRYTSAKEVWSDLRKLPSWQNRQLFPIK